MAKETKNKVSENLETGTNEKKEKSNNGKYPKVIFLIILNELSERFSYYGLQTILFIYLTTFVNMPKNPATSFYAAFGVFINFASVTGIYTLL